MVSWPNSGRTRSNLFEFNPNLVDIGRVWSRFGRRRAKSAQHRARWRKLAELLQLLAKIRPSMAEHGSNSVDIGRCWSIWTPIRTQSDPTFGRVWSNLGPNWARFDRNLVICVRHWLKFGRNGQLRPIRGYTSSSMFRLISQAQAGSECRGSARARRLFCARWPRELAACGPTAPDLAESFVGARGLAGEAAAAAVLRT